MAKLQLRPDVLDINIDLLPFASLLQSERDFNGSRLLKPKKHKKDRYKNRMQKESRRRNRGK